ncbi:hypothetical protein KSF73_15210 [Burkholderiaceae bacterium DAT-1]|nr:hypothetical protein [Burkholderiaceae bacterium DAT-1]
MRFISLTVGNFLIFHGYDENNAEIIEEVKVEQPAEKVVALDRILSATEKYVLVTGPAGRQMYWEYEGGLASLKQKLAQAGLMI